MLILQARENVKPGEKEGIRVTRTVMGTRVGSSGAQLRCPRCAECSRWRNIAAAAVRDDFFSIWEIMRLASIAPSLP